MGKEQGLGGGEQGIEVGVGGGQGLGGGRSLKLLILLSSLQRFFNDRTIEQILDVQAYRCVGSSSLLPFCSLVVPPPAPVPEPAE